MRPFAWLTPDGYPDRKESWTGAAGMLARWDLGLTLAGGGLVPGFRPHQHRPQDLPDAAAVVDHWVEALLHRPMLPGDRALLLDFLTGGGSEAQLVALVLDSPYFLWR